MSFLLKGIKPNSETSVSEQVTLKCDVQTSLMNVCAFRASMQQFPKFILCSTVAF